MTANPSDAVCGGLLGLAARCEQATAEQQREMLEAAWTATHGSPPRRNRGGDNPENRFVSMLDAEAYESAARTLVPEGLDWIINTAKRYAQVWDQARIFEAPHEGVAATPALALCAASLRALGAPIRGGDSG